MTVRETEAFAAATKMITRMLRTFPPDDAAMGAVVWRTGGCEALVLWADVLRDIAVMTGDDAQARDAGALVQACRDLEAMIQEEIQNAKGE